MTLRGDGGVVVSRPINTSAGRGLSAGNGGDVTIESAGGPVAIHSKIVTRGGLSGDVTVNAGAVLTMSGTIKVDDSAGAQSVGFAGRDA